MKAASLVSLALAAGCAGFERQRGHDQVASLVRERTGASTGWASGGPDAEEIARRVDALLTGGLGMDGAVEIALVNNPALQATYEDLGISQADLIQAGLLKNPALDVSVGFPIVPGAMREAEFSVVQEFLDLFMLPLRKRVAEEQFLRDVQRVAQEAMAMASEVRMQLVDVQAQQEHLDIQRRIFQGAEAAADLSGRQHRAGNITDLELATRKAASEQARVDVAQAELQLAAKREKLNRLLGLWGPRTAWKLKEPLLERLPADPPPDRLESLAIRQRLDIAAARTQVALLAESVTLARTWRWFGRVEVGVHGHQDPDGPRLVGPTLTLELPLFDQRQALIARLEAEHRQGERRLAALSVDARSEVREVQARLSAAGTLVEHLRRTILPLRGQVVAQTQLQYNGMQLGLFELLQAKEEELRSRASLVEALREYWRSRAELERLVGGRLGGRPAPETSR